MAASGVLSDDTFAAEGNRTATVSLVFPAEDERVDLMQCRVELNFPVAYQQTWLSSK